MKNSFIAFAFIAATAVNAFDLSQLQQALQQQMQAQYGGNIQSAQNMPAMQTITQDELTSRIKALGVSPSFVQFEPRRDGLKIDQRTYIDPEGKIVKYGYDSFSGLVTYMAEMTPGQYMIKTMQAKSANEPIVIARASYTGTTWDVMTVTGKHITGNSLVVGSNGFTVSRDASAISFDATKGLRSVGLPDGYTVADFQNGDITQTGDILLEILPETEKSGELLGTLKALGSHFGLSQKSDYGLFNIESGKFITFNIASEDKNRNECVQRQYVNSVAYKCKKSFSYESLFNDVGQPNTGHYYWRVIWMNTPSKKPISITIERGVQQLIATDLTTGKKVLLKERLMGINQFNVKQNSDGKISVDVQLGFDHETINDVESLLNSGTPIQES